MSSASGSVLRITLEFHWPRFSGLDRQGMPEWPPSPFRLSQALMAGCSTPTRLPEARAALVNLTQLDNPRIVAPPTIRADLPKTFTHRSNGPMQGTEHKPALLKEILDLSVLGMTTSNRTGKPQGLTLLGDTRLVYEVSDPDASVDASALDEAARRVPYFGRSQDGCDMTVSRHAEFLAPEAGQVALDPLPSWRGQTRGWAPNSCEWMDLNHASSVGGSQRPPLNPDPYVTHLNYGAAVQTSSVNSPVGVVELERPVPSNQTPALFRLLRPVREANPSVRIFPCVIAGGPHSDGRVRGVGVAGDGADDVALAVLHLQQTDVVSPLPPDPGTRTLDPQFWGSTSARWVSATPFRAFPDERVAIHVLLEQTRSLLGLEPKVESLSRQPLHPWQRKWPQPPDGLGSWWLMLRFDEPVSGPLQLGRSTELGFGLFIPEGAR